MKLLDIGSGPDSVAHHTFPDAEITRLDVVADLEPDIVHDITQPFPEELHGQFDIVFASHVLEHIYRAQIGPTLRNLREVLRNQGEFWCIVPSLEWAAMQVLQDKPHKGWDGVIYGGQKENGDISVAQLHKHGFTLMMLRDIIQASGFVVREAYRGEFILSFTTGDGTHEEFPVPQNIVVGIRLDEE